MLSMFAAGISINTSMISFAMGNFGTATVFFLLTLINVALAYICKEESK